MFHKVKGIRTCGRLRLLVWFEGGETRLYDVRPLLDKWEVFKALEDDQLFRSVHVVGRGYGIAWNDAIDLACDELYHNGTSVDVIEIGRDTIISDVIGARESVGLTQSGLEAISGVSQPVIARMERGETAPQLDTLLRVLAPLGKTLAVVDMPTIDGAA